MQLFNVADWECVECGRGLDPGDKSCPSCGSTEARRRPAPPGPRVSWPVVRAAALVIALGLTAFFIAQRFVSEPSVHAEVVSHYKRGQALLAEGKYEEAVTELETVIRLAPESVGGHHELAKAYDGVGRHVDALREMRQTLRLTMTDETAKKGIRYSEESDLRFDLAILMAKDGEFAEAVSELEKGASLSDSLAATLEYEIILGISQAGRGRSESADQAFARATELSATMAGDALTEWLVDRPDGPETPVLRRALSEMKLASAPPPPLPTESFDDELPETPAEPEVLVPPLIPDTEEELESLAPEIAPPPA